MAIFCGHAIYSYDCSSRLTVRKMSPVARRIQCTSCEGRSVAEEGKTLRFAAVVSKAEKRFLEIRNHRRESNKCFRIRFRGIAGFIFEGIRNAVGYSAESSKSAVKQLRAVAMTAFIGTRSRIVAADVRKGFIALLCPR